MMRDRRRFVVRRRISPTYERFDVYTTPTLRAFVVKLIEVFADADPQFLAKVVATEDARWMTSKLKKRHYIEPQREHLYIESAHLTDANSVSVRDHWIITNIGAKEVRIFLKLCSDAAAIPLENISKISLHK
jgi:hypothetical protein